MTCPVNNAGFSRVGVTPTAVNDPTYQNVVCNALDSYYVALRVIGPSQGGCSIIGNYGYVALTPVDIGTGTKNFCVMPQNTVGLIPTTAFIIERIPNQTNRFRLKNQQGLYINSIEKRVSPARNVLGNALTDGTVQYFFIPPAYLDADGNVNFNAPFQLGCIYSGDGNNTVPFGDLVSAYCQDSNTYEICMQSSGPGGGPGPARVITFVGDVPLNQQTAPTPLPTYQTPFNVNTFTDSCVAFACNSDCTKVPSANGGGTSMPNACITYVANIKAQSPDPAVAPPGRISVNKFLTPNGIRGNANKCLVSTEGNLFGLMSDECINFCQGTGTYADLCLTTRQTFCNTVMPIAGSLDDDFDTLCACFWPVAYYAARTQQTVDAISALYPGLRDLLSVLFTDNVSPQCNYAPCNTNNAYILSTMTTAVCRPVNLCLQSINANIGTATNSDINVANSCVINQVNNDSTGVALTPDQQKALDAYNNGTINNPTKQSLFTSVVKSFSLIGWILFGITAGIILILLVIMIILLFKKVVPPPNTVIPGTKTATPTPTTNTTAVRPATTAVRPGVQRPPPRPVPVRR